MEINGIIKKINRGVPQGSSISPYLFNIFQNSLYKGLRKHYRNTADQFFSFADDLAFTFINIGDLKWKLLKIKQWAEKYKLKINELKSGILFKRKKAHIWALNATKKELFNFPIVDNYKYLGVILDRNLNITKHF